MLGIDRAVGEPPPALAADARLVQNLAAALPAVLLEKVRHAADRVGGAAREVDGAVAVEIPRVAPGARGHALRDCDRPGIGGPHREHVSALLAAPHRRFPALGAKGPTPPP